MSKETEKIMKQFTQYMEANQSGEAEMEQMLEHFIAEYNANRQSETPHAPQTADDYLELAEETTAKRKKKEYVQKALELEPDNLDAAMMMIELTVKHPIELLQKLTPLLEKGTAQMEEAGYFRDNMGEFWLIVETRPYMRLRQYYLEALTMCGMMKKACAEAKEMLDLCENDNLGARYTLMHLYALLEDEQAALDLHARYEGNDETQMLLPLAALYFKLNDFDRSLAYLKRLYKVNPDTKKFLVAVDTGKLESCLEEIDLFAYHPFSMEELAIEYISYSYLFESLDCFFSWARRALKR